MVDVRTTGRAHGAGAVADPGLTVAMHMSDGLVNAPTAAVFGLVAAIGLAISATRARADLDERTAPMAGLVTAFVFAVQMINFPILPGASGHLLGGALVAILVGPWVGSLCIAIVLVVQALLFADGGLTALGTNITNMALVGTFTGYGVAYALRRFAARSRARAAHHRLRRRAGQHRRRVAGVRVRVRRRRRRAAPGWARCSR